MRLGEEGVEELLAQTINVAVDLKLIKPQELTRVIVDSTVQHKAIAHPTDSRLLETARTKLVEEAKEGGGKVVHQQFIRLGERRGDFVAVTSGLKAEQTVVSTGVFKLRNGQSVVVDNALAPEFKLAPQPKDS